MQTVATITDVRTAVRTWRAAGERVAFVPTMGNLHEGHLTLVREARSRAGRVVVSIFVNPLQFGPGEDFDAYPRTLERDRELLASEGADLLFAPTEREIYPRGREGTTFVEVPGISDVLCGADRPGHFRGVATVVAKLFNIVQPDLALFGRKDYQQLLVIKRMVAELDLPVEVAGVDTVREADGLAMSSRNGYLPAEARAQAVELYRTLRETGDALGAGDEGYLALEQEAMERLRRHGFAPDYVAVRRADDLEPPEPGERRLVVLAAARLGTTRLIDNLLIEREKTASKQALD